MNILTKQCQSCSSDFIKKSSDSLLYWSKKKFCSKKCANDTNKNYLKLIGVSRPLEVINKMKRTMFKPGIIPWNKGKEHLSNDKHPMWKGSDAGYTAKHMWIASNYGRPKECEFCAKDNLFGHNIHWANKSGQYSRDRDDWLRLCAQCHTDYDKINNLRGVRTI